MEIKSLNDGLLTNIEVLSVLQERAASRAGRTDLSPELHGCIVMEQQVIQYIKESPVGGLTYQAVREKLAKVKALDYGLTEGEMIQLANHCPNQPVDIHVVMW
jgi:hypothetical protein